ncbi:MAG: hypothetical protein M9910_08520 [Kiritimatiellae bacterium]|nr:hypothetical protein [Kiritimatiellia bacterium]
MAAEKNVPTAGMRETNDLCFITAAGPAPLIEKYHPHIRQPGPIVDESGKRDSAHTMDSTTFTVAQRC